MTDSANSMRLPLFPPNPAATPDSVKIREKARQKAQSIKPPPLESMSLQEIQQMFHEMQMKQLETELNSEHWRNRFEQCFDQVEILTTVTENMLDMVALSDLDGNYIFAGKSHETLGYHPSFLMGKNVMDYVHPDDFSHVLEQFAIFIESGDTQTVEYRYRCRNGSYLWLETAGRILRGKNGNPQGIVFSSRDITARKRHEESLDFSRSLLKSIIESSPHAIFSLDTEYRYTSFNQAHAEGMKRLYGAHIQLGHDFYEYQTVEVDRHKSRRNIDRALGGEQFVEEAYSGRPDLSRIYVSITHNPIRDKLGNVIGVSIFGNDITERKKAEEALRESEHRFKTIIRNLPGAVFAHDLEGRISFVNRAASVNTGYSEQELLNMTVPDIDSGRFTQEERYQLWHSLNIGESKTIRSVHTRKDGSKYPVEIHLNSISIDSERILLPIVIDITDRVEGEENLRKTSEKLQAILDHSPLLISEFDTKGCYQVANPAVARMFHRTPSGLIGKTFHELLPPDTVEVFTERIHKVVGTRGPVTVEDCLPNQEGELHFNTTLFPLFDSSGEVRSIGAIAHDVTDQKEAEKEREKLQNQLSQAQKMESVGRLAGGVAHDFNNMLAIINGYAEMTIEMMRPEDPLYENLVEIHNAGKRSAEIVNQLMAFARQQTIKPVELDLNDSLSSMLKMLQRLIGENINLTWSPGNNLWPVKIDPSQLDQIMVNLAANARDAISDIGKLTIETRNVALDQEYCRNHPDLIPGQYVMLAVSDDGCGMEKDVQDHLFEPFFTTKEIGRGTGLGLPTVYGIARQNNGCINVYSEPGRGTTFTIYLPRHDAQEASPGNTGGAAEQLPTGSGCILLVEDEAAILQMAKIMLEKLGYTVLTAARPELAIKVAEEYDGKIDLLMTDVVMPEMNGKDLALQLLACNPALKTLFMSGYTADVIAHHGILEEGVKFIQKPFSLKDMAAKVRKAIDHK